jgi:uncharacterized protein (DUF2267 family)
MRTTSELVAEVAALSPEGMPPEQRGQVVETIGRALRDLVPDEAADVAAVLPHDLRELWEAASAR